MKRLLVAMAAIPLLAGCSRLAVTTEVKPDGSWTRTDVFAQSTSNPGQSAQLSDVFVMPARAPWKTAKTVEKDEVKYTSRIAIKGPAQLSRDILVRGKNKGPVMVSNDVAIRDLGKGRWEYREMLHWAGASPKQLVTQDPEIIATIKAALPAIVATEATARALAAGLIRGVWGAMFGPGQSILPQIMLQPDSVEHVLLSRMSRSVDRTLGETLGSKLTTEERRATVLRLIKGIAASAKSRSGSKSPGESEDKDGTDLPALTFVLRPPGRVSDTNGDLDVYSNEVMWTLYPEAAALGDVVLKATWEVGK